MARITFESEGRTVEFGNLPDEAVSAFIKIISAYTYDHSPSVGIYTDPNGAPMKINLNADNMSASEEALALLVIHKPIPKT